MKLSNCAGENSIFRKIEPAASSNSFDNVTSERHCTKLGEIVSNCSHDNDCDCHSIIEIDSNTVMTKDNVILTICWWHSETLGHEGNFSQCFRKNDCPRIGYWKSIYKNNKAYLVCYDTDSHDIEQRMKQEQNSSEIKKELLLNFCKNIKNQTERARTNIENFKKENSNLSVKEAEVEKMATKILSLKTTSSQNSKSNLEAGIASTLNHLKNETDRLNNNWRETHKDEINAESQNSYVLMKTDNIRSLLRKQQETLEKHNNLIIKCDQEIISLEKSKQKLESSNLIDRKHFYKHIIFPYCETLYLHDRCQEILSYIKGSVVDGWGKFGSSKDVRFQEYYEQCINGIEQSKDHLIFLKSKLTLNLTEQDINNEYAAFLEKQAETREVEKALTQFDPIVHSEKRTLMVIDSDDEFETETEVEDLIHINVVADKKFIENEDFVNKSKSRHRNNRAAGKIKPPRK